ncbi:tRNA pseudouridine synthase C [Brenneria salicis ATCC 15712 = DSM 30166]|uniref:tRNA pseudouridine synthase C n=2 Tax=Brenneria salicis TaxID=55214 RepID=A0A366I7G0_9GAMM|nr:tRNA pseudouridine synthase C [Brenneria salicis ATCC 15712 = DSM 30166]
MKSIVLMKTAMLEIIYQDEHLVAINKPAGWLVHRSWLDRKEKVVVMQTLRDQIGQHVYTVHRLDRPTSGVLLLALSSEVARSLSQQFELHRMRKIYHAVVRGYIADDGVIDYPLTEELDKIADKFATPDKAPQPAVSNYRVLAQTEMPVAIGRYPTSRYSLLELSPQTGRKHQLRRHLSHIRHPIIGDSAHGDLRQNRGMAAHFSCGRLMLHASQLTLPHPVSGEQLNLQARWDAPWQGVMSQFGWQGILPDVERVEFPGASGQDSGRLIQ